MSRTLASFAFFAAVLSVMLKVALSAPVQIDADRVLDQLSMHLSTRGVREIARIDLTSEGTYRAARYATLTCRTALVALPILRNSEAKGLMDMPEFPIRYVVGNTVHESFPHLSLWLDGLITRLRLGQGALPPLALVADPACIPSLDSVIL